MPLTDYKCQNCGNVIHTDDQIAGKCDELGGGCGEELPDEMRW